MFCLHLQLSKSMIKWQRSELNCRMCYRQFFGIFPYFIAFAWIKAFAFNSIPPPPLIWCLIPNINFNNFDLFPSGNDFFPTYYGYNLNERRKMRHKRYNHYHKRALNVHERESVIVHRVTGVWALCQLKSSITVYIAYGFAQYSSD